VASAFLSWAPPARIAAAINRWFDAAPGGQALRIFLALFVAIWTSFQIVSYASIDLHFDLAEAFAWSRQLALGYNHPPLTALVTAAWFSVFPIADWSFHLLAMLNVAAAFYAVDLIARRYLGGDKRLMVLLLLLLTPLYQFHGQRFNANAILLSIWPIATYCFLRSLESRTLAWSVAAGAMAAIAMLGKYYSILLVAAFIAAALVHPERARYLRSPAPWVSTLAGLIVLAPHLHWFLTTGGQTLLYFQRAHPHGDLTTLALLWIAVRSLVAASGYVVILFAAYLLLARPRLRTLAAAFWPADPNRRMLAVLLLAPLLLPIAIGPLGGVAFSALWTMPAWFLLPIVLLSPPEVEVSRPDAVRLAFVVLCFSLAVLAASPAIAWARFAAEEAKPGRAHYAAVSRELTRAWRDATQRPLAIVTGPVDLATAVAFYSKDHPKFWYYGWPELTPRLTPELRARSGWAVVCPAASEPECVALIDQATAQGARPVRLDYEHTASFFGRRGPPVRFIFVLVPPRA
jgi:4-amino-4-deoxy-L-arabinose transferase-like glycosyltransferase